MFNDETVNAIKITLNYEKKINELKEELQVMKENEINRINREFLFNDYERRFQIKLEDVVSVIVGEENIPTELNKLKLFQKVNIIF